MLTPAQELFNKRMSKVRESVEWAFGKVVQYFAFLDFRKNLKVLLQPIGKYYVVGVLLINCHTCLYGSVTSDYFSLPPPDLHTYLNWQLNSQTQLYLKNFTYIFHEFFFYLQLFL